MNPRDIAIRTILGEAANEGLMGQAAVAHVLLNRARDKRWPETIQDVALQPKQFSAWNSGAGGNDLVRKYGPGDDPYERAGAVYDQVASGQISDPTGGATHYYSPAGMTSLVNDGAQSNILPRWLQSETAARGAAPTTIGGHIFTGRAQGDPDLSFGLPPVDTNTVGQNTPFAFPEQEEPTLADALAGIGAELTSQQQPAAAPAIMPVQQSQGYQPVRRDPMAKYLQLFQSLRG